MARTKEQKQLDELEAESSRLSAEAASLEQALEGAALAKLGPLTSQLSATRSALAVVNSRLDAARAEAKSARKKLTEAELVRLQKVERELWEHLRSTMLGPIAEQTEHLREVQGQIGLLGGWRSAVAADVVYQCVDALVALRCQQTGNFSDYPFARAYPRAD